MRKAGLERRLAPHSLAIAIGVAYSSAACLVAEYVASTVAPGEKDHSLLVFLPVVLLYLSSVVKLNKSGIPAAASTLAVALALAWNVPCPSVGYDGLSPRALALTASTLANVAVAYASYDGPLSRTCTFARRRRRFGSRCALTHIFCPGAGCVLLSNAVLGCGALYVVVFAPNSMEIVSNLFVASLAFDLLFVKLNLPFYAPVGDNGGESGIPLTSSSSLA